MRYLTEIGGPGDCLQARKRLTLARMTEVLRLVDAAGHTQTLQVLARLCPPDNAHIAALWIGFAMSAQRRPRIRLYANNGWGAPSERWLRLVGALRALGAARFAARLQPLIGLLVPTFSPAGFAVTVPAASPVCKLYLRPLASPWAGVRALGAALLGEHAASWIAAIEAGFGQALEALPSHALLVSVSGSAAGSDLDLKLDLCGHCMFDRKRRPGPAIERLARALDLDPSVYAAARDDIGQHDRLEADSDVAFVGVGTDALGNHRINVYLTAPALVPCLAEAA